MFWWTLASLITAINTTLYKNILLLAGKSHITSTWIQWVFAVGGLLIMIPIILLFPTYLAIDLSIIQNNIFLIVLIGINSLVGIVSGIISQYAYKNEKISTLSPFSEVGRIFTIILGFFFFSGTLLSSFLFALLAAFVLILSNINFHTFSINKYCVALLGVGFIRAVNTLSIGYIISQITTSTFISLDLTIVSIALFLFLLFSPKFSLFIPDKSVFPRIFGLMSLNNTLWLISYAITLFLMRDLGIVITSLLGMIAMVLTILSSYLFLHDTPTRKDIAVAIVVMCCIIGGTIL